MSDEPFGRQLKPVHIQITGGDAEDREHWMQTIKRFLISQPCDFDATSNTSTKFLTIYPDANND